MNLERDDLLKTIAEAYGVPVEMLSGRTWTLTYNQRDMQRFYTRHNAMLKGWRRRQRRIKAYLSKLAHMRPR